MDNDFIEFSDEFTVIMPSPPNIPNYRSFFILPQKRKDRKEPCGYAISRFSSDPPNDFLCTLCQNVVKKPAECKKCGKLYCDGCATMLKKSGDSTNAKSFTCSICGCVQEPKQPSMVLMRMIGELKMKCANYELGCHTFITIEEMGRHEFVCPFREVSCENHRNCRKTGLIKDFIESEGTHRSIYSHMSVRGQGRHRSYACSENCRKIVSFEKMVYDKQHHKALLEYYNVLSMKNTPNP